MKTDMADEVEALRIALEALKRIAKDDPGTGGYIAKKALEEIHRLRADAEEEGWH